MRLNNIKIVVLLTFLVCSSTWASQMLASKNACMACHAQSGKLIGPTFDSVREKYNGNANAVEIVKANIKNGGAGKWGAIPMPRQDYLTDAELSSLALWILNQSNPVQDNSASKTEIIDPEADALNCRNQGFDTMSGEFKKCMQSLGHSTYIANKGVGISSNKVSVQAEVPENISLKDSMAKCEELGFKKGAERFGKCVLTISR